ncbi:hypothetical protein DPMN_038174 [Dreissena polymorpha]|uniref:Uncharacterized protein n=1 Tax=Dreissena polymorpha TaxID=45954 RepID=A0A9D4MGG0_DREPO|nr:hypothetical protein DPMN_038174 [Dreissena polymorpha]
MAPDTKVPTGRTDGQRQNNIPPPLAGDNNHRKIFQFNVVNIQPWEGKTAPPTGGHVFQRIGTTFELNQDIIKKNILTNFQLDRGIIGTKFLTKFHEDWTRNVASRTDGRTDNGPSRSQKLT